MFTPILYIDDNKTYYSYVEGLNDESFSVEERRFLFYNKKSSFNSIISQVQVHHENPELLLPQQTQGKSVEN